MSYNKAYYEAHKEARKEQAKAYYQAHKEQHKASVKAWKEAHKDKVKAWNEAHKEQLKARMKEYTKAWKEANKDKVKAWNEAHKEQWNEYMNSYLKSDLNALGQSKQSIRQKSRNYLRKYGNIIEGYQIHHCCTYTEPYKFIYCSREMHNLIHAYLRAHNIDADSNHYDYIKHLLDDSVIKYNLE